MPIRAPVNLTHLSTLTLHPSVRLLLSPNFISFKSQDRERERRKNKRDAAVKFRSPITAAPVLTNKDQLNGRSRRLLLLLVVLAYLTCLPRLEMRDRKGLDEPTNQPKFVRSGFISLVVTAVRVSPQLGTTATKERQRSEASLFTKC